MSKQLERAFEKAFDNAFEKPTKRKKTKKVKKPRIKRNDKGLPEKYDYIRKKEYNE